MHKKVDVNYRDTYNVNHTTLAIDKIRTDGNTRMRVTDEARDVALINEYAERLKAHAYFPPPVVFYDGTDYWLADGFIRYAAEKQVTHARIKVEICQGTQRDAILYSAAANADHGARRTNADKRNAVLTLLQDAEWSSWSNRQIAKWCAVDHKMVGRIRDQADKESGAQPQILNQRFAYKKGKVVTINIAPIGHGREKNSVPVEDPWTAVSPAQLREDKTEWYTTDRYLEPVRKLFGGNIDLDPASCPEAQKVVKATRYFDRSMRGESLPWHGRIFLNPPYDRTQIKPFINGSDSF